jgi:hypothetical protein
MECANYYGTETAAAAQCPLVDVVGCEAQYRCDATGATVACSQTHASFRERERARLPCSRENDLFRCAARRLRRRLRRPLPATRLAPVLVPHQLPLLLAPLRLTPPDLLFLLSTRRSHFSRILFPAQLHEVVSYARQPTRAVRRRVRAALQLRDGVRDAIAHRLDRKLLAVRARVPRDGERGAELRGVCERRAARADAAARVARDRR